MTLILLRYLVHAADLSDWLADSSLSRNCIKPREGHGRFTSCESCLPIRRGWHQDSTRPWWRERTPEPFPLYIHFTFCPVSVCQILVLFDGG